MTLIYTRNYIICLHGSTAISSQIIQIQVKVKVMTILVKKNVIQGELYSNTFSDIDNYCDDNKDGAQCLDDVCDI